ncbi:MAG: long-chain fatty acid--CoA ligase [Alphaproteobacteria bacterium]|nr:long-chain fatty acid--CoA ligase [Alphaproteobacteria bacterium]
MPLFHVFAVSMALHLAAHRCGTLVLHARYRPETTLDALERDAITLFPAGPTVFHGLLGHASFVGRRFPTLRYCYSGSAPLPSATLANWAAATGCPILEGYGQSEAGPVLSFNPAVGRRKPGSVGLPVPGTEIEIFSLADGRTVLPAGERGEIRARGPQIMSGYRNRPVETAEALREGWLYTGDIGELDDEGYLYIRDRRKDLVIVGGYNVYPREVEEVLFSHPAVQEAAAVGAPDRYRGEVVHAFVVLRAGAAATVAGLLEHCHANLAPYKVPTEIALVPALAKTAVGMIDRVALRAWRHD